MAQRIYRIHPAIGIARLGNADRPLQSEAGYFIGPESPGVANASPGGFKDANGKIRAQAARFRVFEYELDANGKPGLGREVHLNDGRTQNIEWTVELANKKASFFNFDGQAGAADLHATRTAGERRNHLVKDGDSSDAAIAERLGLLDLLPGPRSISGKGKDNVHFTVNRPPLKIDTLGELRTDADGRLIVIAGKGQSDRDPALPWSHGGTPGEIRFYANNDQWFDDISDGPITARVTIEGATHDAEAAWVMSGPPDFVPPLPSYRTLYDTIVDTIVRGITLPDETVYDGPLKHLKEMQGGWNSTSNTLSNFTPSFTRDIYPILAPLIRVWRVFDRRLDPTAPDHNFHGGFDFKVLGGPESDDGERRGVFGRLRDPRVIENPQGAAPNIRKMPNAFGDFYDIPDHPGRFHSVSLLQYAILTLWKDGQFHEDWAGAPNPAADITPEGLDRAALTNAVGGAFFPGIEVGWLIQKLAVYAGPFRFALGKTISATAVGNLKVGPGLFSSQMALPWQADFLLCRGEPTGPEGGERMIGWWPVQRPDNVFPDPNKPRLAWARTQNGDSFSSYQQMVEDWWTLGFVTESNGDLFETNGPVPPSA